MKSIVVILAIAPAGFIGWKLAKTDDAKQSKVEAAPAPTASPKPRPNISATEVFELRGKCQRMMEKAIEDMRIGIVGPALVTDLTSHYNPVTNHCCAEQIARKNDYYTYPKGYTKPHVADNYYFDSVIDVQNYDLLICLKVDGDVRSAMDFRPERKGSLSVDFDDAAATINQLMHEE
jgi:hypothetical protein